MMSAEGDQVVEAGLAAVRPMMDVMSIRPGLFGGSWGTRGR